MSTKLASAALAILSLSLSACGDTPVRFGASQLLLPDSTDPTMFPASANIRRAGSELLISEPLAKRVTIASGCPGACVERAVTDGRMKPARAKDVDLDRDGDVDLLIADLGLLYSSPTDQGRVMLAEAPEYKLRTLAEGLQRVACAEAGDLDGDGDLDVVACVFGETQGGILVLDHEADGTFTARSIYDHPGTIHAFPVDVDGDGDLDIAAVVSQLEEKVLLFRNQGGGKFLQEVLMSGTDSCFGFSSLEPADLDGDGDIDLLVTAGDYSDADCQQPTQLEHHGLWWLRNDRGSFTASSLVHLDGAYVARAADLDGDGDLDIALAAYRLPEFGLGSGPILMWLGNEGGTFQRHDLTDTPEAVITLEVADLDADGRPDLVAGSLLEGSPVEGAHRVSWLRNLGF